MNFLDHAAKLGSRLNSSITLYNPAEAMLRRVAGHERAHILAQSASRKSLQDFLSGWNEALTQVRTPKVRWMIDVDPLEF